MLLWGSAVTSSAAPPDLGGGRRGERFCASCSSAMATAVEVYRVR